MPLDPAHIEAIYNAVVDKAKVSGLFDRYNDHEPDNPPGRGLTFSALLGPLKPVGAVSGLSMSSALFELTLRLEIPRTAKSPGQTDKALLYAAVTLMAGYIGDFELAGVPDGLVRNVDIHGAHSSGLGFVPGWNIAGEVPYRMGDISLPLILNDVFTQGA